MLRGRTPRTAAMIRRAVSCSIEPLEGRQLLTTLFATAGQPAVFDYYDANEQTIRIQVTGTNFVGEFLGARVDENNNRVIIRDLVSPPVGENAPDVDGTNLFNIYIAEASADVRIVISHITINRQNGRITAEPFAGSSGAIRVTNNGGFVDDPDDPDTGGATFVVTPPGRGQVYIGARLVGLENQEDLENIPVSVVRNRSAYGVRPASARYIFAGIECAPDVSLNRIFIGGTVTGRVFIPGSIDTFYAGNILTGDATGIGQVSETSVPNNFFVGGDLRNLLIDGSVGTNAIDDSSTLAAASRTYKTRYRTGFELRVGGKLGNVQVHGAWIGSVNVINNPDNPYSLTTPFIEIENHLTGNAAYRFFQTFGDGVTLTDTPGSLLGTAAGQIWDPSFYNDAVTSHNFGSSYTSATTGLPQSLEFQGYIATGAGSGDGIDNYSLPLIAGQTVVIGLTSTLTTVVNGIASGVLQVGIFDPFGRLVASDWRDANGGGQNEEFRFTATMPGTYRVAVVPFGDSQFVGGGAAVADSYTLTITNVGELALGGIAATGNAEFGTVTLNSSNTAIVASLGVSVRSGDLGAIHAGAHIFAPTQSPISVSRGNLRVLEAASIGQTFNGVGGLANFVGEVSNAPDLVVPRGTVGYLHTTATTGVLAINPGAISITDGDSIVPSYAIGFDYQRVEAAGQLQGNLVANGGIGTIIAGQVSSDSSFFTSSRFYVNADNRGNDGTIDLIDVVGVAGLLPGDFGDVAFRGPAFKTGTNGNVKYLRVLGEIYRDQFFGNTLTTDLVGDAGQTYTITDDSGARALITPTNIVGPVGGATTTFTGALTLRAYGVRDHGGIILASCTTSSGLDVISLGGGGTFDIGVLTSTYANSTPLPIITPVVYNAATNQIGFTPTTGTIPARTAAVPLDFNFSGRLPINVLSLVYANTNANVSNITNLTLGELASTTITGNFASLGYVNAQSVGFIKKSTDCDVMPATNMLTEGLLDAYSFGIEVASGSPGGYLIQVASRENIGNVHTSTASPSADAAIGSVRPNYDGKNDPKIFEGITGQIFTDHVVRADVGEGMSYAGTGNVVTSGIIGTVEVSQVIANNADIRGLIGSLANIRSIIINNGSLIGARVRTVGAYAQMQFTANAFVLPDTANEVQGQSTPAAATALTTQTAFSLGSIRVNGNGGIIGTNILASDFNAIDVRGGFGIIGSDISSTANQNPDGSITTDGLGIRDSDIDAGSSINLIQARGQGQRLNVLQYSPSVRLSESGKRFDPFSGRGFSAATDLHVAIGTSKTKPRITGITNSGIIENSVITGSDTLLALKAYMVRAFPLPDVAVDNVLFTSRISFANRIGKIDILSSTQGMQLTTGRLDQMVVGGNMEYTTVSVTGPIKTIIVGGSVRGTSNISAKGDEGSIGTLNVRRALGGTVSSSKGISSISAGSILSEVGTTGSIGNLNVVGDVVTGAFIHASKNISRVFVGGDVQSGGRIKAKAIGSKTIVGTNFGSVTTG